MDEDYMGTNSLVETTDSLEAVGVFRGWKNFLFLIVLLCCLLVQVAFWLANLNCVGTNSEEVTATVADVNSAAAVALDANQPADAPSEEKKAGTAVRDLLPFTITEHQFSWALRLINCIFILATVLYCMALLFGMKVTLVARLGGVSHICRAFFLSLIMLILLLPWQKVFGPTVLGAIYTPAEVLKATRVPPGTDNIFVMVLHYLRFCGYWFLMFLLLILAQVRSGRWTKAILRRLEVI
jgi:hypothetical protein